NFADRVVTIPNWIDAGGSGSLGREEARARFGITKRMAVGIVGQITQLKRQDLFIKAAAHLIKDRYWNDADFLIVGEPGPDDGEYAQQLRQMAEKLGVVDRVR